MVVDSLERERDDGEERRSQFVDSKVAPVDFYTGKRFREAIIRLKSDPLHLSDVDLKPPEEVAVCLT